MKQAREDIFCKNCGMSEAAADEDECNVRLGHDFSAAYRKPKPWEVRDLPLISEDDGIDEPIRDLATAVCGFIYPGDKSQAIIDTVKYLRANPDMAAALGIGS